MSESYTESDATGANEDPPVLLRRLNIAGPVPDEYAVNVSATAQAGDVVAQFIVSDIPNLAE